MARDQEVDAVVWTLSGPDDHLFTIGDGVLRFREPPNFEDPQSVAAGVSRDERNVYRVTVEAHGGTHDVTVTVMDVDEAGTVRTRQVAASGPPPARSEPVGRG